MEVLEVYKVYEMKINTHVFTLIVDTQLQNLVLQIWMVVQVRNYESATSHIQRL